ncbi:MAG: gamma-glutamyl-phosphate reductase, partial [Alphaproteobacteria bacterium]|nr:gamma-glutamyl-phosphate reductase [Alphaproteobacteria bacterium]
ETLLIDAAIAPSLLPDLLADLRALGCDFRAGPRARAIVPDLPHAPDGTFDTEWLDAILSIAVVDNLDHALRFIRHHGSEHTDCIVTEDPNAAATFLAGVDSAVAMWNASTQFCDGATGRIHARGPIGLEQLTTFRYHVIGTGQVRP